MRRGGGRADEERIYKVAFWNVAGLKNKDTEFWRGLGMGCNDIE